MLRQATTKDIDDILPLYKAGLEELGLTDWKESLLVKKIINSFALAPCFLLVIDDKICGMAGFTLCITSHNGVATLSDYMFYVLPEYRNIKNLGGLVEEAKQFATVKNFPIKLEFICNNDEKLRKRVLEMHGFKVFSVTGVYNG
jgi:hypothetical protein